MKLPNAENAVVSKAKILDYLLANTSKSARAKAGFFSRFGFTRDDWSVLRRALLRHAREYDVESEEVGDYGARYTVIGELNCPDGRHPVLKTVWIIDDGFDIPRLITAYPSRRKQ